MSHVLLKKRNSFEKTRKKTASSNSVQKVISTEYTDRPVRWYFVRRVFELKVLHFLYQADQVKMFPYAKVNKKIRYLQTVMNTFSTLAFALPLKTKAETEVAEAHQHIFAPNSINTV